MEIYFLITFIVLLLFSFSLSGYLTNYKFNLKHTGAKVITFFGLGAAISSIMLVLSIFVIWP